jgi:hypothetical protein
MTELTSQVASSRELAMEPHDEVEILLTSSSVLLRGVDRDVFRVRSLGGEDVADDFEIERLPGKVRLRDIATGFKVGSIRIRTNHAPDLEIEVPRAAALSYRSLSGDVEAKGTAGESRWATASGDIRIQVDGGPVVVESMSGDVDVVAAAPIELRARSVSGDLAVRGPRFDALAASSTSGDIRVDAAFGAGEDHVISSVSGDVELTTSSAVRVSTQSVTGDVHATGTRFAEGGRGRRTLVVGAGTIGVSVRTTSGDIRLRGVAAAEASTPTPTVPQGPPASPRTPVTPAAPVPPAPPAVPAPIVVVAEAEAAPNLVRPAARDAENAPPEHPSADDAAAADESEAAAAALDLEPVAAREAPFGTASPIDRREAARLEILRALERGDLDLESASHKLEILEDAGPRFFRGWC